MALKSFQKFKWKENNIIPFLNLMSYISYRGILVYRVTKSIQVLKKKERKQERKQERKNKKQV